MLAWLLACTAPPEVAPRAVAPARARKGDTLTVDCNGGAEYVDLTTAIKAADSGDRIEVAPCTYAEQIDFRGRSVHIVGTAGAAETILEAPAGDSAVKATEGEGPGTILEGFTVRGGGSATEPAIEEQFSSLELRDVTVSATAGTVTVYARSAMLKLVRVHVDESNNPIEGVLVQGRRGQIVVKDSRFDCGAAGLGYEMEHGAAFLDGADIRCAGARAAWIFHANGRVQRSRFEGLVVAENEDTGAEATVLEGNLLLGGLSAVVTDVVAKNNVFHGAGVWADGANLTVSSSIFSGASCGVDDTRSNVSVASSLFWNNTADACGMDSPVGENDNRSLDPLFTDPAAGDFTLQAGSPGIDAGSADAADRDIDGSRNDIGAYGGPFSMAGGW